MLHLKGISTDWILDSLSSSKRTVSSTVGVPQLLYPATALVSNGEIIRRY